jgi:hypothetical protein
MGFARLPPPCRSTLRASTPGSRGFLRSDGATRRSLVPPSWFLTTSAACSAQALRVCCTPLPALGFDAFHAWSRHRHPKVVLASPALPASRVVPFEEFPSSAAVPHHCDRCPLAVAACSDEVRACRSGPSRYRGGGRSLLASRSAPSTCHWVHRPLRRHPLPDAAVSAAPVKQSTPGRFSTDESVATCRRFQRSAARVSHGLCSPPRYLRFRCALEPIRPESSRPLGSRLPDGEPPRRRRRPGRRGESRLLVPQHPSASWPLVASFHRGGDCRRAAPTESVREQES